MDDDELSARRLVAWKCRGEQPQHREVSEHPGLDSAAAVSEGVRGPAIAFEQLWQIGVGFYFCWMCWVVSWWKNADEGL